MNKTIALLATAGFATVLSAPAQNPTRYSDQSSFLAAMGGPPFIEQSFGNYSQVNGPLSYSTTQGSTVYLATTDSTFYNLVQSDNVTYWLSTYDPNSYIDLTFTAGHPEAFGGDFFMTDENSAYISGGISIVVTLADSTTQNYTITPASSSDFWGIIAQQPITEVALAPLQSTDYLTVGEVITPVPEPSSLMLLGMGTAGLIWGKRRKLA
jgi:hypothetical protein